MSAAVLATLFAGVAGEAALGFGFSSAAVFAREPEWKADAPDRSALRDRCTVEASIADERGGWGGDGGAECATERGGVRVGAHERTE